MLDVAEILETNQMVASENLDVRTITMGISLLDCMTPDLDQLCQNIYDKITTCAKDLVKVGDEISLRFGARTLTVEVLSIQETVRQSDAATLYREVGR